MDNGSLNEGPREISSIWTHINDPVDGAVESDNKILFFVGTSSVHQMIKYDKIKLTKDVESFKENTTTFTMGANWKTSNR